MFCDAVAIGSSETRQIFESSCERRRGRADRRSRLTFFKVDGPRNAQRSIRRYDRRRRRQPSLMRHAILRFGRHDFVRRIRLPRLSINSTNRGRRHARLQTMDTSWRRDCVTLAEVHNITYAADRRQLASLDDRYLNSSSSWFPNILRPRYAFSDGSARAPSGRSSDIALASHPRGP